MIEVDSLTKVFGISQPSALRSVTNGGTERAQTVRRAGGFAAVNDVSFSVERGEVFAIMGLSGSGKSTLIRMINRLVKPTTGTVKYDGVDVGGMNRRDLRELRNERISMVFQHFALFPHRTVRENAAYGLKIRGFSKHERLENAERALDQVGLGQLGDSYPDEFSGGMKQRVGLARALATDPDVLIMDEPFSALDPLTRRAMQDQLQELQQRFQKTILFVTHDLNEAMRIGDRIMMMKDGESVQLGTAQEIISSPANAYVQDFIADVDRTRNLTASAVMQSPWLTATAGESPRTVLARVERSRGNGVYIIDARGRVVGIATDETLSRVAGDGSTDLRECVLDDYTTVAEDTPISEFSHLTGGHAVPLAVVDGDEQLIGVVPRTRILDAIASETHEAGEHA
ncbi:glycine betaine/proline transport system ATP-binding protein [Lipingzhangella halophila]|uniref:Glycine betaine/proline transport system ATP-binding protein n=1 Tax=Lipingzhangella halophila TaxID=1783352 RepID=A0A7W7W3H3_9ACTN|nr:betaine/proline/choline family ABC transporter ATP-binding protein [Lipingzhangella halophila]MBB4932776.1 glycine betaine/proline transport system ATP-binding protein [Lipingzhangella halophila]